jgi:hypothetical protein
MTQILKILVVNNYHKKPTASTEGNNTDENTKNLFKTLLDTMKVRKRFNWKLSDLLCNAFCLLKCRHPCSRNKKREAERNYNLLMKGQEMYESEMDLVTILTTIRKVNWLMDTLMDDQNKVLE